MGWICFQFHSDIRLFQGCSSTRGIHVMDRYLEKKVLTKKTRMTQRRTGGKVSHFAQQPAAASYLRGGCISVCRLLSRAACPLDAVVVSLDLKIVFVTVKLYKLLIKNISNSHLYLLFLSLTVILR